MCYCMYEQSRFIDAWEPGRIYFGVIFQSILWNSSFHGASLTVYQTVN